MSASQHRTLSQTLDSLPLSRIHIRIWIVAALGFVLEALDLNVTGAVLPTITKQFHLDTLSVGLIGDAALAGYLIGVAVVGVLADRFGRARMMKITVAVFTIITLIGAFAWNDTSFAVLRLLAGIGIGGEAALLTPYVIELLPKRYRGRFAGLGDTFYTVGLPLATLVGLLLIPTGPNGWRWALFVVGIPAVYVLVMRRALPESPRWLFTHDRLEEAESVVTQLGGTWHPTPEEHTAAKRANSKSKQNAWRKVVTIWSHPLTSRTALLWGVWFFLEMVYYAFLVWLPSLLVDRGYSLLHSLAYTFIIYLAAIIGGVLMSLIQETRLGRRYTLIGTFILSIAAAILFGLATTSVTVVIAGSALSLLMNGAFAVLYTITPESYPTEVRSSGQGLASMFGHFGSLFGPIGIGIALPLVHFTGIFIGAAIALALALVFVFGLHETRGRSLDESLTGLIATVENVDETT